MSDHIDTVNDAEVSASGSVISNPNPDLKTLIADPDRAARFAKRQADKLAACSKYKDSPKTKTIIYIPGPAVSPVDPAYFSACQLWLTPNIPTEVSVKDADFLLMDHPRRIFLSDKDGKPIKPQPKKK